LRERRDDSWTHFADERNTILRIRSDFTPDRERPLLRAIRYDRLWPIGEVHDRPLIQCTTGRSGPSAEEVKREAN